MKKPLLSLVIIVFIFVTACEQEDDLSLKVQKVSELQKKAKFPVNPLSFDYLKEADDIIKSTKNIPDSVKIENIFSKGYCYRKNGVLDSAAIYFHKAIDLIDSTNTRKRDIVYYRNSWVADLALEHYGNVLASANKFMRMVDRENHYNDLYFAFNAVERTYRMLNNHEKALVYNDSVQQIVTASSNTFVSYITYFSKSGILVKMNQYDEAFRLMDSLPKPVESLSRPVDNYEVNRQLYRELGIVCFYKSDFQKAIDNYKTSLSYLKKIRVIEEAEDKRAFEDSQRDMLEGYLNISESYIELRDYASASKYLDSANTYVDTNTSFDNLSFLGEVDLKLKYLNTKNVNDILDGYYKLFNNQNKIHEQKIDQELAALTAANEKEKLLLEENKEQELHNLRLQSSLIVLAIFLVLLSLIGYLFYRQRKLRYEKNDLLLQQRLLRSQMNPHFTFNALNSIKTYIAKDQETATHYLLRFSRLLRLILENSAQNFVELELELELLEKYLELQLVRFPEKFTYEITLENIEEDDLLFIPPMLLQPFIENSIEHGFSGIDYKGHIHITLKKQANLILCTIDDNGKGLPKKALQKRSTSSTELISDFIQKSTKTTIEIIDKNQADTNESGVRIEFFIPYKLTEND